MDKDAGCWRTKLETTIRGDQGHLLRAVHVCYTTKVRVARALGRAAAGAGRGGRAAAASRAANSSLPLPALGSGRGRNSVTASSIPLTLSPLLRTPRPPSDAAQHRHCCYRPLPAEGPSRTCSSNPVRSRARSLPLNPATRVATSRPLPSTTALGKHSQDCPIVRYESERIERVLSPPPPPTTTTTPTTTTPPPPPPTTTTTATTTRARARASVWRSYVCGRNLTPICPTAGCFSCAWTWCSFRQPGSIVPTGGGAESLRPPTAEVIGAIRAEDGLCLLHGLRLPQRSSQ